MIPISLIVALRRFYRWLVTPEPNLVVWFQMDGRCPDCLQGTSWLLGPTGGLSHNVKCPVCSSEFNIAPGHVERVRRS